MDEALTYRILICGSRGWHDPKPIEFLLDSLMSSGIPLTIIHGDAPGADRLAKRLAEERGLEVIDEPADWKRHGKGAGPKRNQKMIDDHEPDVIYAFRSSGKSNGTDDMCDKGRAHKIPTFVWNEGRVGYYR